MNLNPTNDNLYYIPASYESVSREVLRMKLATIKESERKKIWPAHDMTKFVPRRSARLKQQSKTLQKAINVDNRCFKSDGVINPNNEFNNLQLCTQRRQE